MNWYNKDLHTIVNELNTDLTKGLTSSQVLKKRNTFGNNEFEKKKRDSIFKLILNQLRDISIIILLIAALLSLMLAIKEGGGFIEPIVIFGIVIMNVILALSQERSAEKALEALANLNSPHCKVMRNGLQQEILTTELVPGDIIILGTGDYVPSDARLIESNSLAIDEASLTGESEPSEKNSKESFEGTIPLGDQKNMVFMGCLVVSGRGKAIVTTTGMNTEMGKIAGFLNDTKKLRTPLQNRLNRVGKLISFIAILSAALLFFVGSSQGEDFWHMVLMAVTLAVAAVPETLSLIVTLSLTEGVKNMVNENALIRKLPAVETLGSVSIICSDKTGTLTQNQMNIKKLWIHGKDKIKDSDEFDEDYTWFLEKFVLASSATLEKDEDGKDVIMGDPTESAVLRLMINKDINQRELEEKYEKVYEIPFSSERKMMTTVVKTPDNKYIILTKGAFDRIPINRNDEAYLDEITKTHDSFAKDALRVIALASKTVDSFNESDEIEKDLNFEGFIGLIDPPRAEAFEAIKEARMAGIRTIMITGDHAVTAEAIAKELGIISTNEGIITGHQLSNLSDDELVESINFYSVYARVSPADKIRIVSAWQERSEVVSMTGDGVNDAPALKAADVGIAMGINGTEVAKNASDMVLTDDNFATIISAVKEGRNVFSNIRKTIYFLCVCNISEIIILLFAQIMGWGSPVTPTMLLLINVIGDGIPGLHLAKEKSDTRIMKRKPIGRNESFFAGGLLEVIIQQTFAFSVVTLIGFYVAKNNVLNESFIPSHELGQTVAFLILGWTSIIHIFTVRTRKSFFKGFNGDNPKLVLSAFIMILVFAGIVYFRPIADNLGFAPLSGRHWLMSIGLSLIPITFAEYEKLWDNYKIKTNEKNRVVHCSYSVDER